MLPVFITSKEKLQAFNPELFTPEKLDTLSGNIACICLELAKTPLLVGENAGANLDKLLEKLRVKSGDMASEIHALLLGPVKIALQGASAQDNFEKIISNINTGQDVYIISKTFRELSFHGLLSKEMGSVQAQLIFDEIMIGFQEGQDIYAQALARINAQGDQASKPKSTSAAWEEELSKPLQIPASLRADINSWIPSVHFNKDEIILLAESAIHLRSDEIRSVEDIRAQLQGRSLFGDAHAVHNIGVCCPGFQLSPGSFDEDGADPGINYGDCDTIESLRSLLTGINAEQIKYISIQYYIRLFTVIEQSLGFHQNKGVLLDDLTSRPFTSEIAPFILIKEKTILPIRHINAYALGKSGTRRFNADLLCDITLSKQDRQQVVYQLSLYTKGLECAPRLIVELYFLRLTALLFPRVLNAIKEHIKPRLAAGVDEASVTQSAMVAAPAVLMARSRLSDTLTSNQSVLSAIEVSEGVLHPATFAFKINKVHQVPQLTFTDVFCKLPCNLQVQIKDIFVQHSGELKTGNSQKIIQKLTRLYLECHPDKHKGVVQKGYYELQYIIRRIRNTGPGDDELSMQPIKYH